MKIVALPVPEIIVIGVLGRGCEPPIWGKGGVRDREWYRPKERL